MSQSTRLALKIGLPIVILLVAGVLTFQLITSREAPVREETETRATAVEVERVRSADHRLNVRASGEVIPARQISVQPQVGGQLVEVHPELVPGGLIEEGERLFQIDRSDYELAVEQQETALAQAQAQLELEQGQQEVAEREWELFREEAERLDPDRESGDPSLATREPQLRSARAQVEAARTQLKAARLDLQRTSVEASFNALVLDESVAVGQLVSPQSPVATLVGTDRFWVQVSIETDDIPQVDIPDVNADEGSAATVRYEVDSRAVERDARVARLLGDLDPEGRMARLLVELEDPLHLRDPDREPESDDGMPLLLDAYVDVVIEGNEVRELIELPRRAVRNGEEVYIVEEGRLQINELEIAWRRPESVLVASGVEDGDLVVTGPLASPVEGMPLEPIDSPAADETDRRDRSAEESADRSDGRAPRPLQRHDEAEERR